VIFWYFKMPKFPDFRDLMKSDDLVTWNIKVVGSMFDASVKRIFCFFLYVILLHYKIEI
jgi:hypothetical protein